MVRYKIYTDGACSGNPGPGGWGVVISVGDGKFEVLSGGAVATTNNRMELQAMVQALQYTLQAGAKAKLQRSDSVFQIHSDSAYVVNGITLNWIDRWKQAGWKTKGDHEVKNAELWQQIDSLLESLKSVGVSYQIVKVKGHSGDPLNEYVDKVAKDAIP